jgi:hypothetical protein
VRTGDTVDLQERTHRLDRTGTWRGAQARETPRIDGGTHLVRANTIPRIRAPGTRRDRRRDEHPKLKRPLPQAGEDRGEEPAEQPAARKARKKLRSLPPRLIRPIRPIRPISPAADRGSAPARSFRAFLHVKNRAACDLLLGRARWPLRGRLMRETLPSRPVRRRGGLRFGLGP